MKQVSSKHFSAELEASELPQAAIDDVIDRALREDLVGGDLTSTSCVDKDTHAVAKAYTRHPLTVCGGPIFARVFQRLDARVEVAILIEDGSDADKGDVLWQASGPARSVLTGERVALNFTQRLCGIASMSRRYSDALTPGSPTRVADTRKTTPGLRLLERYAVRTGGAHNHRDNLGSAVMIKDNHIVAAGGITTAVKRAKARAPHTCRIECEVANHAEMVEAYEAGADIIMLDNMSNDQVTEALAWLRAEGRRPTIVEASGGITIERIGELSKIGVDVISVGALTHSFKAADISLEFSFRHADASLMA